jgi:GR25 family glycosyltransferase involved in LPS biosynthesis
MMNSQNFPIYVLNFDGRIGRYEKVESQLNAINYVCKKISAKTFQNTTFFDSNYCSSPAVQAKWFSHLEAYTHLIESKNEFCLVLEDDVLISDRFKSLLKSIDNSNSFNFDILQIGFIKPSKNLFKKNVAFANLEMLSYKLILAFLHALNTRNYLQEYIKFILKRISKLDFIVFNSRQLGLRNLVIEEFLSSTNSYIIHRNMASRMLNYNKPITMSAELGLRMLSISGNWRIFRTADSYILQNYTVPETGAHISEPKDISSEISEDLNP